MEEKYPQEAVYCPRCENIMIHLQTCHLRCSKCGTELTCSDKGYFW